MENYSGAPPTPPYSAAAANAHAPNPSAAAPAAAGQNPGGIVRGLFMAPRMNSSDGKLGCPAKEANWKKANEGEQEEER